MEKVIEKEVSEKRILRAFRCVNCGHSGRDMTFLLEKETLSTVPCPRCDKQTILSRATEILQKEERTKIIEQLKMHVEQKYQEIESSLDSIRYSQSCLEDHETEIERLKSYIEKCNSFIVNEAKELEGLENDLNDLLTMEQ